MSYFPCFHFPFYQYSPILEHLFLILVSKFSIVVYYHKTMASCYFISLVHLLALLDWVFFGRNICETKAISPQANLLSPQQCLVMLLICGLLIQQLNALLKHVPKYCPIQLYGLSFAWKYRDFCMRPHAKGTLQVGEFVKNPFRSCFLSDKLQFYVFSHIPAVFIFPFDQSYVFTLQFLRYIRTAFTFPFDWLCPFPRWLGISCKKICPFVFVRSVWGGKWMLSCRELWF
jgi:hypothetical protein